MNGKAKIFAILAAVLTIGGGVYLATKKKDEKEIVNDFYDQPEQVDPALIAQSIKEVRTLAQNSGQEFQTIESSSPYGPLTVLHTQNEIPGGIRASIGRLNGTRVSSLL